MARQQRAVFKQLTKEIRATAASWCHAMQDFKCAAAAHACSQ
jgi:hypothetical protein